MQQQYAQYGPPAGYAPAPGAGTTTSVPLGEEGEATAPAEEDPLRRFLFEEADVFSEPFEDFPAADEEERQNRKQRAEWALAWTHK